MYAPKSTNVTLKYSCLSRSGALRKALRLGVAFLAGDTGCNVSVTDLCV